MALSDSSGDIVETYSYDVFGEPNRTSSVGNPYMFTGRRYDPETELYYYRARYYDSETGRFLQTDPVGYIMGLNLYTYVGNNPVNYIDPMGRGVVITSITGAKVIYHGVLSAYAGYECIQCVRRARQLIRFAQEHLDACQFETWRKNAKPGVECAELCGMSLEHGVKTVTWLVTRWALLRAHAFGKL